MPDASTIDQVTASSEKIMTAANRLETGAAVFLVVLSLLAILAFSIWLKSKRDAKAAENKRLEIEQKGKTERAKMISASNENIAKSIVTTNSAVMKSIEKQGTSIEGLAKEIHGLRGDMVAHGLKLEDIVKAQTAALTNLIQSNEKAGGERELLRDRRLTQTFHSLQAVMRELLDRQKGVINFTDSVRIIEESYTTTIKPQVFAISERSIRANHWARDAVDITERVNADLNAVFYTTARSLANYQLAVDHRLFYPTRPSGTSVVVETLWGIIKSALASAPADESNDLDARVQRAGAAKVRLEKAINAFINETKATLPEPDDDSRVTRRVNALLSDDLSIDTP